MLKRVLLDTKKCVFRMIITRQFKYSLNKSLLLTVEDQTFYENNGYLVVKKLIPNGDNVKYVNRFQQVCTNKIAIQDMVIMQDVDQVKQRAKFDETSVNKLQNIQNDPILFSYCRHPKILKYTEAFIGNDIMAASSLFVNKPPDTGNRTSRHPLHQDLHYFPFRPANLIVASWTALEHVHRDNGCLVVVPGSHKEKLLEHVYPDWKDGVNWAYHGAKGYGESSSRVHLIMEPGDTVFFHPLLIHGSGTNRTSGFRKAISCHFASSHCHYIDVTDTTQKHLSDEHRKLFVRRTGKDATNFDFRKPFMDRVRLVQGKRVNL